MPEPRGWDNLHPLLKMQTEQVSEGRHDEHGRSVDVAGVAMPMQKIETVTLREAKPSKILEFRGKEQFCTPCSFDYDLILKTQFA